MTRPLPDDTRGILDPAAMARHVDFDRSSAGDQLDGLVEWFWTVAWDLPIGAVHNQQVLSHPAGNISVGTIDDEGVPLDPAQGHVYGVMTGLSSRRLAGMGWTVGARTTVGGIGALLNVSAKTLTDTQASLVEVLPDVDGMRLAEAVRDEATNADRVDILRGALVSLVERRDRALIAEAREVVAVAAIAEHDRSIRRIEGLAAEAGVSVRTLQRLFDFHVGVSPSFLIRRWRIIEAAESARAALDVDREWTGWANVAAELGYADQAHLARDFRAHLGTSPSAYLAQATSPGD